MKTIPRSSLDTTLSALADPTRREILLRLAQGEVRVTDLADGFPCSLNAISKHVRILEGAGLLVRRRKGREHWLRFRPVPLVEASGWLADRRAFWTVELTGFAQQLSTETLPPNSR
jgi:DNA-binding transcriptional ArsR family regulator